MADQQEYSTEDKIQRLIAQYKSDLNIIERKGSEGQISKTEAHSIARAIRASICQLQKMRAKPK